MFARHRIGDVADVGNRTSGIAHVFVESRSGAGWMGIQFQLAILVKEKRGWLRFRRRPRIEFPPLICSRLENIGLGRQPRFFPLQEMLKERELNLLAIKL